MLEKYPGTVRIIFKNFPLRNHNYARPAAQDALAAHRQGRFWEFHDRLFADVRAVNAENVDRIARELNLDMKRFTADRCNPDLAALVDRDLQEGAAAGVRGTPTIFINGRILRNRSLEGFAAQIDEELGRLKK